MSKTRIVDFFDDFNYFKSPSETNNMRLLLQFQFVPLFAALISGGRLKNMQKLK